MSFDFKKTKIVPVIIVALAVCLLFGYLLRIRLRNQADMSNIMAIAGISGAKVYALEPSPDLLQEIDKARSNPKEIVQPLLKILNNKVVEYGRLRSMYKDHNDQEATIALNQTYAYSVRMVILIQWKPGMSRQEIVQLYLKQTDLMNMGYDFKNHADDFLGFK